MPLNVASGKRGLLREASSFFCHRRNTSAMKRLFLIPLALLLASCMTAARPSDARGPRVAHHQHLISPAFAPIVKFDPLDAAALPRM